MAAQKTVLSFAQAAVSGDFSLSHVVKPGQAAISGTFDILETDYVGSGKSIAWQVAYSPDGVQPFVVTSAGRWDSPPGVTTTPSGEINPQPGFSFPIPADRAGQTLQFKITVAKSLFVGGVATVQ